MTLPAAVARRQNTLDRIAELLTDRGCSDDKAAALAPDLLALVEDHGWALPAALTDSGTPRGGGSTSAGRIRARLVFAHRAHALTDGWLDCACHQWSGPLADHDRHITDMLIAGGVAVAPRTPANHPSSPQEPRTPTDRGDRPDTPSDGDTSRDVTPDPTGRP